MRLLFSAGAALLLIVSGSIGRPDKARPASVFEARLHAQAVRAIKLATVVPEGSVWDRNLKQMAEEWKQATGGRVTVTVFGGGSQGDEATVLRKMRLDALQAAAFTAVGLGSIDAAFNVFDMPFFFESYDELNYVTAKLTPVIARAPRSQRVRAAQLGSRRAGRRCSPRRPVQTVDGSEEDQAVHVGGQRPHGPVVQGQRLRAARHGDDRHPDGPDHGHDRGAADAAARGACCFSGTGRRRTCSTSASRRSSARTSSRRRRGTAIPGRRSAAAARGRRGVEKRLQVDVPKQDRRRSPT